MKIEVIKNKVFIDSRLWGKKLNNQNLGDCIINLLFYNNKDGEKEYELIVNGCDLTSEFKDEVKKKYDNIPNTELKKCFFKYANIK